MSSKMKMLFPLLIVMGVAAGLWLLGFFDPAEDPMAPGDQIAERQDENRNSKSPDGAQTEHISVSRFRGEDETVVARLNGEETGLQVMGQVQDPHGRPLGDATVALIRDVSQLRARAHEGEVIAEFQTTKSGKFAFENIVPGDLYVIRASHVNYTTDRAHPIDPNRPDTLKPTIKLQDGLTLSGTITDEAGAVVDDVEVLVFDMNVQTMSLQADPERVARSNAGGRYEVPHLVPGMKRILVRKVGYATVGRNAFDLRGNKGDGVDFQISKGYSIQGIVTDSRSGLPVAGAAVTARAVSYIARSSPRPPPPPGRPLPVEPGSVPGGDVAVGSHAVGSHAAKTVPGIQLRRGDIASKSYLLEHATTGEDGVFVLTGLMHARYMLQVRAKGYLMSSGRTADAGHSGEIEISIAPSGRIVGRVVDDETGDPVGAFMIASSPKANPMFLPMHTRQRFKSEDGAFTFIDVRPGKHHLIAQADGYAGGRTEPLMIRAEQEITGIEIRLVRGATISGVVQARDGTPVSGAEVNLVAKSGDHLPPNPFTQIIRQQLRAQGAKRTMTDASGRWVIENAMAGEYQAKASHRDFCDGESESVTCEDRGEVTVPPLSLLRGGIIHGIVKRKSGEPDERATVMVTNTDPSKAYVNQTTATGADGRFRVKGLQPGSYRVLVTQREGVFDILTLLQRGANPGQIVPVADGQEIDLQL